MDEAIEQEGGIPTKIIAVKPGHVEAPSSAPIPSSAAPIKPGSHHIAAEDVSKIMPITFKRRTNESDAVRTDVVSALAMIPKPLLKEVAGNDVKIVVTPTMPDVVHSTATDRPRGYIHGGWYDNCPAMYSGHDKCIYIAERLSVGNAPPQRAVWIASPLLHEFGHALDHVRKVSSADDFCAAYTNDCARLSNTVRTHYYYYTQTDEAGPSELFAELFAHAVSRKVHEPIDDASMPEAFPRCFAIIVKLVQ